MITNNKKLIKNFKDILASSQNAKSLINGEIEKVDAKYAALAKKEKQEFVDQIKALDIQIEMCNNFLKNVDASAPEKEEAVAVPEDEKVVDKDEVVEAQPKVISDNLPFDVEEDKPAEESAQEEETVVDGGEAVEEDEFEEKKEPVKAADEDDDWGFNDKEW